MSWCRHASKMGPVAHVLAPGDRRSWLVSAHTSPQKDSAMPALGPNDNSEAARRDRNAVPPPASAVLAMLATLVIVVLLLALL
jgi:hypothetical protein